MRNARLAGLLLVIAVTCSVFGGPPEAEQETVGFRVGERVPDLRLPTIDGEETIRLRALTGRKLLLIEFASW